MADQVTFVGAPPAVDPGRPADSATVSTPNGGDKGTLRVNVPPPEAPPPAPAFEMPEKFKGKSAEDIAKAYLELEKARGAQEPPKAEEKPQEEAPKQDQQSAPPDAAPVAALLKSQGLSFDELNAEYQKNGELSPDSFAKLEKAGFPKTVVDQWINGVKASQQISEESLMAGVGGRDQYTAMVEWAKSSLSPQEIADYNAVMGSTDRAAWRVAVAGLQARWQASVGKAPVLLDGKTSSAPAAAVPFQSSEELRVAMSDPRYKNGDTAYHKLVHARLAVSRFS